MPPPLKRTKSGLFNRSKELVSLAASLGAKEMGSRLSNALGNNNPIKKLTVQIEQAKTLMESLGKLKGAAMKVGQIISIEARDFLPPEVIEILNNLQSNAPHIDFEIIEGVLKKELGDRKFARLHSINPIPIASASIGQVHRARFNENEIVLKIQYPGVAESIPSDLKILRTISNTLISLSGKEFSCDMLFKELETILLQETDYLKEADFCAQYQIITEKLNQKLKPSAPYPTYVVPKIYNEILTKTVLPMSYEPGMHIDEFVKTNPSQEMRNYFGKLVLELYICEFFEHGLVQTDPNFSNFLLRPRVNLAESQLVILDFGASKTFLPDFVKQYKELFFNIVEGQKQKAVDISLNMGLISAKENEECLAAFWEMLSKSAEPFRDYRQPFEFSDIDYVSETRKKALAFTNSIKHSPPPHDLIFLHRKLGGVFNMLKTLGAQLDLRPFLEKI